MKLANPPRNCWLLASVLAVVSCGGGGEETQPDPSIPSYATSALQKGHWVGSGGSSGFVGIAVPVDRPATGASLDTLWVVSPDASVLYKLSFKGDVQQTSGQVSGRLYEVDVADSQSIAAASYSFLGNALSDLAVTGLPKESSLSLSRKSDMAPGAVTPSIDGDWEAQFDDSQVNWRVRGMSISGTSTTGCSYSGQLTPMSSMTAYRVQLTEMCFQTEQVMVGIATLNAATDRLSVLATTENDSDGAVLLFTKKT